MGRYRHKKTGKIIYYSDIAYYDPHTGQMINKPLTDFSDEWEKI